MKAPIECKIDYFPSAHLNQIYDGFIKLQKAGLIKINVNNVSGKQSKPILKVLFNNQYKVIYDTLDGINWIDGSIQDNLNYFKYNIKADFYFKRSYNQQVLDNAPKNCKVFPLGFNYHINIDDKFTDSIQKKTINILKNNNFISSYIYKNYFGSSDFEYYPFPMNKSKILFIARLWDPDEVSLDHIKEERIQINKSRIEYIRACRKEFGDSFVGGLRHDKISLRHAKELILPPSLTKKRHYLKTIRECDICIATTGLHNSIGWKFGEYIAASRAIVSEPLKYDIPGDFNKGKNFYEFNNTNELMIRTSSLISDNEKRYNMMARNYEYYNNYLKPDKLVLNSIINIFQYT